MMMSAPVRYARDPKQPTRQIAENGNGARSDSAATSRFVQDVQNVADHRGASPTTARAAAAQRPKTKMAMARAGYEQLVCTLIRPPRVDYSLADLGPASALYGGRVVDRVDSELRNERGLLIQYSRWTPRTTDACGEEAAAQAKKVVVYLHSNSSCRLAVVRSPVVESVCASGYSLLALDFSGCGHSDGEYVTLGCYEQQDVAAVVACLVQADPSCEIVLWGRSMGAVAALLYSASASDTKKKKKKKEEKETTEVAPHSRVRALVLDSPFYSLRRLADDVVGRVAPRAPRCGVCCLLACLRSSAKKRTLGADVMRVSTAPCARDATLPALFLAGRADALAPPKTHAEALARVYAADCAMLHFDGEHNSTRPKWVYEETAQFIQCAFRGTKYAPPAPRAAAPQSRAKQREGRSPVQRAARTPPKPPSSQQHQQHPVYSGNKNAQANKSPPLPRGWEAARDSQSGDLYYYCDSTNETTWLRPRDAPRTKGGS